MIEIEIEQIDRLHSEGFIDLDVESGFYVLREGGKSALGLVQSGRCRRVHDTGWCWQGIKPKDKAQLCMFYALANFDLVVATGKAGTGKTTIASAFALQQCFRADKIVVLTKPTCYVGGRSTAMGAVTGDMRDKIAPYIESYLYIFRSILGVDWEHHLYNLEQEGKIIFQPLELIRGLNFDNHVVIIDEAQNASPHSLLSLISRVGERSQCIVMGDPSQKDNRGTNGLMHLLWSEVFKRSELCTTIQLEGQYRGPLANLAQEIRDEMHTDSDSLVDPIPS